GDLSISYLATPAKMNSLLVGAGFKLLDVQDSTEESQSFFERMTAQMAKTGSPPVAWRLFLGDDFPAMARNQVRNVSERRIRTASYICVAGSSAGPTISAPGNLGTRSKAPLSARSTLLARADEVIE